MSKLALFGGEKTIKNEFKKFNSIGDEEINIVNKLMRKGQLSSFIARSGEGFLGGEYVQEFENNWKQKFNVKHAISVNSWTSGLICAIGALNIEPGDEIILPPWTMSACAMSIIHWNAIPVFADIDPITFCIDPNSIIEKITKKTKAIMAVDIGGQSCNIESIKSIANQYDLKVISDSAQSPLAKRNGQYAGTLTDVGGFSLNCHKHIQTGEGGVIVTNDDSIAERTRLIRNHAESIINLQPEYGMNNMIGYNFRMGEIESAIGIEQLKKLDRIVERRRQIANKLIKGLNELQGIDLPKTDPSNTHSYYMFFMKLQNEMLKGAKRENIYKALLAEGLGGISLKYCNLHLLPIFKEQLAYGNSSLPWSLNTTTYKYGKGTCPVSESLENKFYLGFQMCLFELNDMEVNLVIETFKKVWNNLDQLN